MMPRTPLPPPELHAHSPATPDPALLPPPPSPGGAGLSRDVKAAIVLVTLLQGVALHALSQLPGVMMHGDFQSLLLTLLTVLITVLPAFWVMGAQQLRDGWMGRWLLVMCAVLVLPTASVWHISQMPDGLAGADSGMWIGWFAALAALSFMLLVWMQAARPHRSLWRADYHNLFAHAWENAAVAAFASIFAGLCWLVLGLWAALFAVLGVKVFAQLFSAPLFVLSATGAMLGLGVVLSRSQHRVVQMQLQIKDTLFRLLLPLLALVMVLFAASLPLTGVQPLWDTGRATLLLCGLQVGMLLFVNAVFQDGRHASAPYGLVARSLIHAALLLQPALALIAVWAVQLRVQQYGWTAPRVWAAVITTVLLLYALGYAATVAHGLWLRSRGRASHWLGGSGPQPDTPRRMADCLPRPYSVASINKAMSWVTVTLILALFTPVLNPYRISAADQRQRLEDGRTHVSLQSLGDLRFGHGRYGPQALQSLLDSPGFTQPPARVWLQKALQAESIYDLMREEESAPADATHLRQSIAPAAGHNLPPQDWWEALLHTPSLHSRLECPAPTPTDPQASCIALQLQLHSRQTQPQHVVCEVSSRPAQCHVFDHAPAQAASDAARVGTLSGSADWKIVARLRWPWLSAEEHARIVQSIRAGQLQPRAHEWHNVAVPGVGPDGDPLPEASIVEQGR